VLDRARAAIGKVLNRFQAVVDQGRSNAVIGVFGLPRSREDDALRAVLAASELEVRIETLNLELADRKPDLAVRAVIETGAVLASADRVLDDRIVGWALGQAERVADGDVVIGEGTRELVREAVDVRALRRAGVWKVLRVDPSADLVERHLDAPLIGRDAELARLRHASDWSVRTRSCHLLTLLGPAGIGKSRLARELTRVVGAESRVLTGRCLAYGKGTFWPLGEIVRQAAGSTTPDALHRLLGRGDIRAVVDQISAALGTGEENVAEDAFWAFRPWLHTRGPEGARSRRRWPERELQDGRRRRVLPQQVADGALGVEQGTERAAGEHPEDEAEATGPKRLQLRAGTPGHLLGVVAGDGLVALVHLGRAPVTNAGEEGGEEGVGAGLLVQKEGRPIPAGLDLAALARARARLGECLPEPLRARRTELDRKPALHPQHSNRSRSPAGGRTGRLPGAWPATRSPPCPPQPPAHTPPSAEHARLPPAAGRAAPRPSPVRRDGAGAVRRSRRRE
jgi:hypothetical protein